jgi:hypothetical protein
MLAMYIYSSIVSNSRLMILVVPKIVTIDFCNLEFLFITPYLRKLKLRSSRITILI